MTYTEMKNNGLKLEDGKLKFNGLEFEVLEVDNKLYFPLLKSGMALGYTTSAKGKNYANKERIAKVIKNGNIEVVSFNESFTQRKTVDTTMFTQGTHNKIDDTMFVEEHQLYMFMIVSRSPKCNDFMIWITNEVLPQIRRTGGYIPVSAEDTEEMIEQRAKEIASKTIAIKDEIIAQLQAENEELQAEVDFHKEDVKDCERLIDVLCDDVKYLFNDTDFGVHSVSDAYTIMSHNVNGSRKFVKWFNEHNEKVDVIDVYVDDNGSRIKNAIDLSDINIFHDFKDLVFAYQQEQQGFTRTK